MAENCFLLTNNQVHYNFIKIYSNEEDEIITSKNKKWINHFGDEVDSFIYPIDDFISNILLGNNQVICDDLNYFIENESENLLYWYTKANWENSFWLIGYDIINKKESDIIKEIENYTQNEVLLLLQNAEVLLTYYEKGLFFKRFRIVYEKFNQYIIDNEKNNMVVNFVNQSLKISEFI